MNPQERFNALLSTGQSVFVYLDPRSEFTLVPERFTKQDLLVLEIGLNMQVPVQGLEVQETGILVTLRFQGKFEPCFIAWRSVYEFRQDGKRHVCKPYMPSEPALIPEKPQEKAKGKSRGHLRLVVNNG